MRNRSQTRPGWKGGRGGWRGGARSRPCGSWRSKGTCQRACLHCPQSPWLCSAASGAASAPALAPHPRPRPHPSSHDSSYHARLERQSEHDQTHDTPKPSAIARLHASPSQLLPRSRFLPLSPPRAGHASASRGPDLP
eukprot:3453853-Rhodomonas_salina.1